VWIDALGVSRHHARITLAGMEATLEDLGSKNGTYLQGRRLPAPSRLQDGDQIRLGSPGTVAVWPSREDAVTAASTAARSESAPV
jgi:pSer/pThr/pTyr-binding forkhead associated (FHA) protein